MMIDGKGLRVARSNFLAFFAKQFTEDNLGYSIDSGKMINPLTLTKKDLQVLYKIKTRTPKPVVSGNNRRKLTLLRPELRTECALKQNVPIEVGISQEPVYNGRLQSKKQNQKEVRPFDPEVLDEIEKIKMQAKDQNTTSFQLNRSQSEKKFVMRKLSSLKTSKIIEKRKGRIGDSAFFPYRLDFRNDFSRVFTSINRSKRSRTVKDMRELTLFQFKIMNIKEKDLFRDKIKSMKRSKDEIASQF